MRCGVGHEVGAAVAAVELHALDVFRLEVHRLGFLDGDDAVLAGLVEDVGDELADLGVGGADGRHLGDLVVALDRHGGCLDGRATRAFSAALMPIFICIGLAPAATFLRPSRDDRLGQHGGGGRAVAGDVLGLGGGFLEQLRAHVLERVFELDVARHGDAVVGHGGGAVLLVQADVAALGPERRPDRIRQRVDALLEPDARVLLVGDELGHAGVRSLPADGELGVWGRSLRAAVWATPTVIRKLALSQVDCQHTGPPPVKDEAIERTDLTYRGERGTEIGARGAALGRHRTAGRRDARHEQRRPGALADRARRRGRARHRAARRPGRGDLGDSGCASGTSTWSCSRVASGRRPTT